MKISNTDYNTNFGNFYRLPYTKQNAEKLNVVLNTYVLAKKQNVAAFVGKNPFCTNFYELFSNIAKKENGSLNWLQQNLKLKGIQMPDLALDKITVVTSDIDVELFEKATKTSFKSTTNKFKLFIYSLKNSFGTKLFDPHYIKEVKINSYLFDKIHEKYSKFIPYEKFENCETVEELTGKIFA